MSDAREVLSYVQALIWPAVLIAAMLIFRPQLARMLGRVTEVTAAGASVKFSEQVDELVDKAETVLRQVTGPNPAAATDVELRTVDIPDGELETAADFIEAFRDLESAARDAADTAGASSTLLIPVLRGLAQRGLIPAEAVDIGQELRAIRNRVVHGIQPLSFADTQGLIAAAASLAATCRAAVAKG